MHNTVHEPANDAPGVDMGSVDVGQFSRRLLDSASRRGVKVGGNVAATLLTHSTGLDTMRPLPAPPPASAVPALISKHGYRAAARVAEAADDPELLASLAKHSAASVRRAVAANPHTDADTVEYLWQWACNKPDVDARLLLLPRVPFSSCLELMSLGRYRGWPGYRLAGPYPHRHAPQMPGVCTYVCSVSQRLLPGSPDFSVRNIRAAIRTGDPEFALDAVALCAGGRVDGLSFPEAVELFAQHVRCPGSPGDPWFPQGLSLQAVCVRHALLYSDVPVDAELAGLVLRYADQLALAEPFISLGAHPHGDFGKAGDDLWSYRFSEMVPRPLPSEKLTGPAARMLLASDVPVVFRRLALLSADYAEVRGLLDDRCVYTAYWLLTEGHSLCDSETANQALRLIHDRQQQPPLSALDLPEDVVLDDGLLAWVVLAGGTPMGHPARTGEQLRDFVTGEFSQKPSREVAARMLRIADGRPEPWLVSSLYSSAPRLAARIVDCFGLWRDKPWAADLVGLLGAAFIDPGPGVRSSDIVSDCVADWLFAEFGDSVELWTGCLGLLEAGFPGSLPELVDTVWALFGDGLDRPEPGPDPADPHRVLGTGEDSATAVNDGDVSAPPPRPGSFLAALLKGR